jgi:hypothetical protein
MAGLQQLDLSYNEFGAEDEAVLKNVISENVWLY